MSGGVCGGSAQQSRGAGSVGRTGSGGGGSRSTPMTVSAAARIQSSEARSNGGGVRSGGFASRAQRAAARNGK